MIQRIQSLFLLLVVVCLGLLFIPSMAFIKIGFGDMSALQAQGAMLSDAVFNVTDHVIMLSLVVASLLLALVAIFLFKNRPLQIKLGRFLIIAIILTILLSIILFYQEYKLLAQGTEVHVEYGYVLPVLGLIFAILAIRSIRKDENLVRSSDRLR